MDAKSFILQLQEQYGPGLSLTGLAGIQYPVVLTKQLTFFNSSGNKEDSYLGDYHIFIRRRSRSEKIGIKDHLLFIAKHIELYASEIAYLVPLLSEITLSDFRNHDRAWRIFSYLRHQLLGEKKEKKKSIGRRYIDLGNINSPHVIKDTELHVRDGLIVPSYLGKIKWKPLLKSDGDLSAVNNALAENRKYFTSLQAKPLFYRFVRYASKLESAASATIEGYDAIIETQSLSRKMQKRINSNPAIQAHLNIDKVHRDLVNLAKEPLTLNLLTSVQEAIVFNTWKTREEKEDKAPGRLRPFDEVIVNRGAAGKNNVVYIAPKSKDVPLLLNELIDFYYASRKIISPLQLAAIFKCHFVVIHPFGDGNGRLARWCFLFILIKEGFLENIHQAPISHIFLQERSRYYDELLKVDRTVMEQATYLIDQRTKRYKAEYVNVDIYRKLDYSSWLTYTYDAFKRALEFSVEEHKIFARASDIYKNFSSGIATELSANQQHEILRAVDIGLRKSWGKKTETRLLNNGLSVEQVGKLRGLAGK